MTITIPPGPPRKSPEIDHKTRLKLVVDALLSLRSKANSKVVELERTDENQLTKLHRGEIICELERIHDRDRHTFRIMRAGHTLKTAAKPASLLTGYSEPVYQWAQWKEIPETKPIILALLDGFDNWCEAQTHKQNTTLRTLSENSRLKVFHVVAAIYEQFELTSNPKVSIPWIPASEAKNHDARQLALNFLEAKGVVTRHKFVYGGGVKIGKELPGLDRVPWKGELGQRVYDNISKEAWKLWVEYSKMVMNEYRLNPLDPNSQKIMGEQMEQFFFGEGAKLPEGYVAPKAKG